MSRQPPAAARHDRLIYAATQILMHLLVPPMILRQLWRSRREPAYRRHLHQRLGFGPVGPPGAIWVHSASLGEIRAVQLLVRRLRAAGYPILLTHMSPAGLAEGWRLFPDDPLVTHRYAPWDLFWAMRRLLRRARPAALLVVEVEVWPAMLREAGRAGLPRVLVNGNLRERSARDGGGLRRWVLGHYRRFDRIFTRDRTFADRYHRLGVPDARIAIVGDLKFDQWIDPAQPAIGRRLRRGWPAAAPVLLIASSVQDEEPALLALVANLLRHPDLPDLRIIWAPRSPQRFAPLAATLADRGWPLIRRSAMGDLATAALPPAARILLGDSIGEMNIWYPMADLVFVGGSLNQTGGHNIMEPMVHGRPVVMGPSIHGVAFAAEPAARAGALASLPDAATLEARIAALLGDRAALAKMAAAATGFAAGQTGAVARTLAGLGPLLPDPPPAPAVTR